MTFTSVTWGRLLRQLAFTLAVRFAVLYLALSFPALADLLAGQQALSSGDYVTALAELLPLAKVGDTIAQSSLGLMYHQGLGVKRDHKKSAYWYRLAADHGEVHAQVSLGTVSYTHLTLPTIYSV